MKTRLVIIPVLAAAVMAAGCGEGGSNAVTAGTSDAVPPALTAVFAEVSSGAALLPIPELRRSAKPGDRVRFEAKVMGTEEPFVNNRALFVVGDEGTLISCDLRHSDGCETPWDNCCDDSDALRAGTATVQVVDDAGNVLRHGIRGMSGLKELSRLRIAGVVAPNSTEAAFIVNATKIQIL
jgi:hypothetical protein